MLVPGDIVKYGTKYSCGNYGHFYVHDHVDFGITFERRIAGCYASVNEVFIVLGCVKNENEYVQITNCKMVGFVPMTIMRKIL